MASASSQSPKSCSPNQLLSNCGPRAWPVLVLLALTAVVMLAIPSLDPDKKLVLAVGALCAIWWLHLGARSMRRCWGALLAAIVAASLTILLLRTPNSTSRAGALLAGAGIYLGVWAFTRLHTARALQAVATVAMLFSLVWFARPTVMHFAIPFALIFWLSCGRRFGGRIEAAFLVFTPALLVSGIAILLRKLGIGLVQNPIPQLDLYGVLSWHYDVSDSTRVMPLVPAYLMALAALVARMAGRRSTPVDLTLSVLLLGLLARVVLAFSPPDAMTIVDLGVIAYGSAMALQSAGGLQRIPARLFALFMAGAALGISAAGV